MKNNNISLVIAFLFLQFGVFVIFLGSVEAKPRFDDSVPMNDLVQQIEKSLFLADDKVQKFNNGDVVVDKSGYFGDQKSEIEVIVVDQKNSRKIAEKQKLAYSSSLVGQHEVAIELYKQILSVEPNNQSVKFALATCYHNLSQFGQAKALYYDLLKANPENKDQVIGNLLSLITDESPNDAIYILSRLLAQNPKSSYINAQSAMAYDRLGNVDQAKLLLNKAISIDPRAEYKYNLAIIYDKSGDYLKASELYQDVVASYDVNVDVTGQSIPVEQVRQRLDFIRSKIS